MSKRLIKQIIYGTFYLGIIFSVGYGLYYFVAVSTASCFDNRKNQNEEAIDCGGVCIPCAVKNLKPITAAADFSGIDGNTNLILVFDNPNVTYGADSFNYAVNFYNRAGEKIYSVNKSSFIYPAESSRVVVEPNLALNSSEVAGQPEILISDANWLPVTEFRKPSTQTRQIRFESAKGQVTVNGLVANRESFEIDRSNVSAVIYRNVVGGGKKLLAVSKTVLQDLRPFEERAFKITVPLPEPAAASEISVEVSADAQR